MSLDVYLTVKGVQNLQDGEEKIFIRRAEWDKRFPDREPVTVTMPTDDRTVFSQNITHNLAKMADAAGIYKHLWRPEELGITKARQLIEPLSDGLRGLHNDPQKFWKFNPKNGWGTYKGLIDFVESYLNACREYPDADVYASR